MGTILITGANRGLGLEFCRQYVTKGWTVLACCRNPEQAQALKELQTKFFDLIQIHSLDLNDFQSIENLARTLSSVSIDVLLSNAGLYGSDRNRLGDIDYENWGMVLKVNALAALKLAECFLPHVSVSDQKKMVFVSSKMGSLADNTSGKCYIYRSSKSALNAIVKSLSYDLKPHSVSVMLLHPGWVKTDMGGPNALIDVSESVSKSQTLIEDLSLQKTGQYIEYNGKKIPW